MAIELLKPKDVMKLGDGMHNDGRGLYLQVSNGGKARSSIFRYAVQTEVDGVVKYRDRQMGLGPVYDTDIHQARKLAHDYRELRRLHIDPIEHRDAELMEQRLARGSKRPSAKSCRCSWNDTNRSGLRATTSRLGAG